jgi:hypothetical protein
MIAKQTILAAAALAALTATGIGAVDAQPRRETVAMRHETRRPVERVRVFETLRLHHYTGLGEPYFFHGRYVVRSHDRMGRLVLVELDPWTGRFIGVVRI